jgi:hypothetical protein
MHGPHISLSAETITHIFELPITNSIITSWIVILLLVSVSILVTKNIHQIPSRIQSLFELLIEALLGLFTSLLGKDLGKKFFPLQLEIIMNKKRVARSGKNFLPRSFPRSEVNNPSKASISNSNNDWIREGI